MTNFFTYLFSLVVIQALWCDKLIVHCSHNSNYYTAIIQDVLKVIESNSLIIAEDGSTEFCTYLWVLSEKQIEVDFNKYKNTVTLITSIMNSTIGFQVSKSLKLSAPCSIVTYFDPEISKISFEWVYKVTGGFYNSVHILFLKQLPLLTNVSVGFRVMFNQILLLYPDIFPSNEDQCTSIWTIDLFLRTYISTGKVCIGKSLGSLTHNLKILQSKWTNFNLAPYLFAMSSLIDAGPKQPLLDAYHKVGFIRYIVMDLDDYIIGNLEMALTMIQLATSVNATATRKEFPTPVFVAANISGKMEGLAYEISKGNAHGCLGLSNDWETSRYLILSDVADVDQFSFFTKLPVKAEGSLLFLFETFELNVWVVYSAISFTLIILLAVINRTKDVHVIYAILKPVVEQPLESSVSKRLLMNYKARILLTAPFLSSIVAVSLFKSYVASLLVKPLLTYPPQTIEELADSDYEIGTFMAESTELGSVLRDLKDTSLVRKMTPRLVHYDLATGINCFLNILKGPCVCMGMKSLGSRAAEQILTVRKTGHKPFIWAKDYLISRYSGVGLSKLMPHVKDAGDGFEKRNRLRSKSVQNQAYRRKKNNKNNNSRGKNIPNGDSIRDSVPFHSVSDCSEKLRANFQDKSTAKEREEKTCVDRYFEEKYLNLRELFGEKGRRNKTHSSFVIRLPSGYKGLRRDAETSKSFELPSQGLRDEPFGEGDESLDMTWFRAPASHDSSTGSGMGANGSAHVDGRLKSRSQSSSALYCVGKSGGGNTILEDGSSSGVPGLGSPYLNNYGSDLNCHRGNHTSNGLSTSIPADIWDLPPTAKSFSPIIQKHHIVPPPLAYAGVPNSNHYQFYSANNSTMPVVTVVQQHQFAGAKQQQGQQVAGIPCTVDAFSGRHKKGGGKGGKNRAKLYAVSCPDVAQHTQCANVDHHHQHQTLSYEPDPNNPQVLGSLNQSMARLGIVERIEEGFTATGGKSGFVNGGFTHSIVPDGYRPTKERTHASSDDRTSYYKHSASGGECLRQRQNSSGTSGVHPNQVISNVQLAQSHPHLFVNTSSGGYHGNSRESTNISSAGGSYSNNPAISASYQNIPNQNSFYLHQQDSRMKHHRQQVQPSAAPDQQYLRKSRGSLPNQQMQSSEFPTNEATQNDPKCSLFPIPTFVIPENIFEVKLLRDQRGLGLSVTGGLDSKDKYPGLIRIKKVFPMSPASQSGLIRPWDIILQANGVPLTGLTNHEALEVLRTTPTETILTLCRPPPNVPGFVDALDHSSSQPQLYYFGQQQMQNDPMNCSGQSGLSSKTTEQLHHHYENDGYTSGNSMVSSSVFNPSVKSKSLSSLKIPSNQHSGQNSYGEFEVSLEKVGGSLGFTLRQEDNSVLGHYVRALVKEPALTDGRIQPGDRILSVNGKDLSDLSHAEAINFLRQCPTQVTLRLYRDTSPTPISPLSPSESHKSIKAKPLRQEAIDMLNDLAIRKKMSGGSGGTDPKYSLPGSAVGRTGLRSHKVSQHDANCPATLPRRRHAAVTPSPEVLSAALSRFAGTSQGKLATPSSEGSETSRVEDKRVEGDRKGRPATADHDRENEESYPVENRSSGSGESTPVGTIIQSGNKKTDPYRGYTDLRSDSILSNLTTRSINEDEATVENSSDELNESDDNILRKKPRFPHFTMHLDQISVLDEEEGNASFSSELNHHDSIVSEPGGKKIRDGSNFRHGQPAYQSAILPSTSAKIRGKGKHWSNKDNNFGSGFRLGDESPTALSDIDIPSSVYSAPSIVAFNKKNKETITNTKEEKEPQQSGVGESDVPKCTKGKSGGSISSTAGSTSSASDSNNPGSLLKWKGVLFSKDDEEDTETTASSENLDSNLRKPVGSSSSGSDQGKQSSQFLFVDVGDPSGANLPQRRSPDGREFRECDMEISSSTTQPDGEQIFTVQLSRRWCSRLGFSLQGTNGHTYISAIYPESVAAKDGRLRVGDEVIMVNGETVRDMETNQVIDNMRKTRGIISITLLRKPSSDPEVNLSDSELGLR